ncbi:hypothetical protein GUITHDRAFT_101366 [Guillardia theta CCMP2712]|uniref:Uncharacterized protein n=1 Tax=Guillardia theta (strain CCMP2712) TaxID=905079 RepID=L1JWG9_GUITC|nr:hypothetical protein GUITHDRAFT_101366 [Guillardia theta CCMP2712]EKX52916.1 hypothetical protein GUITHDRAFT_101366 [Guillardia theta CCMP2712]|eukprot:XP_005839896.1 hypothetical protein GUITHDRAFT_101366 [Guillardia theta CCMP2712]
MQRGTQEGERMGGEGEEEKGRGRDEAMKVEGEDKMEEDEDEEISFKYVYIPCDDGKEIQECVMRAKKSQSMQCMLDYLRPYFAEAAKIKSEEQRRKLKENISAELAKNAAKGGMKSDDISATMIDSMTESQFVDIVPLIPAVAACNWMSVTMYVDDKGSAKELPVNARATAIVSMAGGSVSVLGDAFVARAYDNEAEDLVRHDFLLEELAADAPWLREAWRVKLIVEGNRDSKGKEDEHLDEARIVSKVLEDGFPFVPPLHQPVHQDARKEAAEKIRAKGNEYFKQGSFEDALFEYYKSVRYLSIMPAVLDDKATASLVSALSNAAACWLKLEKYKLCDKLCSNTLQLEPKNVKALFRKGMALRGMQQWQEALTALEQAASLNPSDAAVAAERAKAEKDVKKHLYGW